jgi:uncharacterized protein (DUF58 family)
VAIFALILFGAGLSTGWPLIQHLSLTLGGLDVLSYLLLRLAAGGVTLTSTVDRIRLTAGESIEETYRIENRGRWPVPLVTLADEEGPWHSLSLSGHDVERVSRSLVLEARGLYSLGESVIRLRDPLGLFSRTVRPAAAIEVTVYPRPLATMEAVETVRQLTTRRPRARWDDGDGTRGAIREYAPGDSPSRIHWPTSARRDTLMVADPESAPPRSCWLLVDLSGDRADSVAGIAAYLVQQLSRRGQPLGALIAGETLTRITARPGAETAGQMLHALAVTAAADESRLDRMLRAASIAAGSGALLVITPAAVSRNSIDRVLRSASTTVRVIPVPR